MRHVRRGPEPTELHRYRLAEDPNRSWEAFPDRAEVLERLLDAQHHLCCYCTGAIHEGNAHVEHYWSRAQHPERALDWGNLLACCDGRRGLHCDGPKADQDLARLDPADRPERHLRFLVDGTIASDDPVVGEDLELLGLCLPVLNGLREAAVDAVIALLGRGEWTRIRLERALEALESSPKPYGQWQATYLRRRLARAR